MARGMAGEAGVSSWWAKVFEKRGTVTLHHMPDKSSGSLKKLSDQDLHKFISGWKVGSADHIAGTRELERRTTNPTNLRSWIALVLSILAVVVAFIDLLKT